MDAEQSDSSVDSINVKPVIAKPKPVQEFVDVHHNHSRVLLIFIGR